MKIMSFDPGLTTGVAVLTHPDDIRLFEIHVPLSEHQCREKHLYRVWEHLMDWERPDEVVYEDFTYQHRTTVELFPVQVIGVINLYGQITRVPIFSETASAAKRFWTDYKLKAIGRWVPGKDHAMDALRHLLYHEAIRKKNQRWLEGLRS